MMRVLDVMTTEVITVEPTATLKEAARLMMDRKVSGLPVVEGEKLVGIITEADFLDRTAEKLMGRAGLLDVTSDTHQSEGSETVASVMTEHPYVMYQEASLTEVARAMVSHGVKRFPVVDNDGRLIGVISRADVVSAFSRPDDVIRDEIRHDLVERVLGWDVESIEVEVTDGVVLLRGNTEDVAEGHLLEELVRRIDGVVGVKNETYADE